MLDNVGGPSACYLICIVLYVASELIWCTHMQGISAQQMGGPSACYLICIVLYVANKLIWCTHMQGIYAQQMGGQSDFGIWMCSTLYI